MLFRSVSQSRYARLEVARAYSKITRQRNEYYHLVSRYLVEYYEDHFRKAVALEWDIRLTNPKFAQNDHRVNKIKSAFTKIFNSFDQNSKSEEYKKIFDFSFKSLDKV